MNKVYTLGICERFSPRKHVKTQKSSWDIESHWLIYTTIHLDEFYDGTYKEDIEMLQSYSQDSKQNIKLDIIINHRLEGGEYVGFITTFWLAVLQRKWKAIYEKRQKLVRQRGTLLSIRERQITGKWRNS